MRVPPHWVEWLFRVCLIVVTVGAIVSILDRGQLHRENNLSITQRAANRAEIATLKVKVVYLEAEIAKLKTADVDLLGGIFEGNAGFRDRGFKWIKIADHQRNRGDVMLAQLSAVRFEIKASQ